MMNLLLPMAVLAGPISAQGFEGTVTMNVPAAGAVVGEMKYLIKGEQMAVITTLGSGSGPMAGAEVRMIMDMKNAKTTMLIPISGDMAAQFGGMGGGNMKGIKQVVDLNQMAGQQADPSKATFKALGTSQTIAGHKCADYEISDGKDVSKVCLASDMGAFAFAGAGGLGGRRGGGGGSPTWAALLKSHPGFPLKVTGADGKVSLEVTKIEKGAVDQSMFEIPDGYMDMGGMMGGRRGGGGN
jgi:hypothetical protein